MESDKNIGDAVVLNFGDSGLIRNAFISGIRFTMAEVNYDVKIYPFLGESDNEHIIVELKDVRGYYVEHPEDRFTGKSHMPFQLD
jgi:hypothetical protein